MGEGIPRVEFEIFTPTTEKEVRGGTVSRAKATCICCNTVLAPDRVRTQLAAQRGGADVVFDEKGKRNGGARLLAVVTLCDGQSGRHYRLPTDIDYAGVWKAQQRLKEIAATKRDDGLCPIPNEAIPRTELRRISMPIYGMTRWRDCFTSRQALAYVWEVVGRMALEQVLGTAESRARNGGTGALEEDARLTALFLWTLQATTQEAEPEATADEDEPEPEDDEEDDAPIGKKTKKGLSLPFDVARRFAQPLGIHLDAWEGRCIETEKGIVRLIPVLDRAKQLFGDDGAEAVADRLEKHCSGPVQPYLFAEMNEPTPPKLKANMPDGSPGVRCRRTTILSRLFSGRIRVGSAR